MIELHESTSTRKLIDVTVTPSATGVSVAGTVRWFDALYTIPPIAIPCVYADDARYRVALCSTPPRLVLVEDDATPPDEVCYLARWAFSANTDTCATVAIEVPRRVLVDRPPTVIDTPRMESYDVELVDEATGETRTVTRQRQATGPDGEPLFDREVIPAEPLPTPTPSTTAAAPELPATTPERAEGRKIRRRVRDLRQQLRALKDAGTTVAAMTAAQRALVVEYVGLTGEAAPLAVP